MDGVRFEAGVAADLVVATSPPFPNETALLVALYGIDGTNVGEDEADSDLSFPVTMDQGAGGVYSTKIKLSEIGVYWARVTIAGIAVAPILIRVVPEGSADFDGAPQASMEVGVVVASEPASVELAIYDTEGALAGNQPDGTAWGWPLAMTQVPGYPDSWYFSDVAFDEGGKMQAKVDPATGPSFFEVLSISSIAPGSTGHFQGWSAESDYDPSAWVPISYIRRWTGWTTSLVSDADIRELRRHAVETFIDETNRWFPAWTGTFRGLRGQGSRLYLPMPILLPTEGGIEPEVHYTEPEGDQDELEEITVDDVSWRVRGVHDKQPFVEMVMGGCWDPTVDVRIRATWGSASPLHGGMPLKVQQVIVGLMRWHSLSFGKGPDEARDQGTLFRVAAESTRDAQVRYADQAIGEGLTGDVNIDRALAQLTILPGPWIVKHGALPAGYGFR